MKRLHPKPLPHAACWSTLTSILCVVFLTCGASGQSVPTLSGSPQISIQRGQTSELTLNGLHLSEVSTLAMSHPRGLQVTLLEPSDKGKPGDTVLRLQVTADADAGLGDREVRFISSTGVSAPLRIAVVQYPQVTEKEPNNTPEQAQSITFPVTLSGKIGMPGDIDSFRFTASKGQTLVFDIHAARSRSQLDPVLTIHTEAGRELTTKVDLNSGDPTVLFEVPADGPYILAMRDLQYRGGEDYSYRIDAGAIPYVQSVLPLSARPGKLAEVKPIGVNLNGAGAIPLDLTYAREGEISVRARSSAGMSNAVKIEVSESPIFLDEKPAHTIEAASRVALPVDISGRIEGKGDENYYAFHIAKKQRVTLEAITRRMGSPVDALLVLRNAQGGIIQTTDAGANTDAVLSRELEPGDYGVSIRDLFFGGGPTFSYRLRLHSGHIGGNERAGLCNSLSSRCDSCEPGRQQCGIR